MPNFAVLKRPFELAFTTRCVSKIRLGLMDIRISARNGVLWSVDRDEVPDSAELRRLQNWTEVDSYSAFLVAWGTS